MLWLGFLGAFLKNLECEPLFAEVLFAITVKIEQPAKRVVPEAAAFFRHKITSFWIH